MAEGIFVAGKVFDVQKIKIIKTAPAKPVKEPSAIKLQARYFDWHTATYLVYALAVILGVATAAAVTKFMVIAKNNKAAQAKPDQEKIITPPSAATPNATQDTKPAIANPFEPPKQEPKTDTPAAETIDKKSIKIRVLNGNGTSGDAAKTKKQLEDAGFEVAKFGNAARQDYAKTLVYYVSGKKDQAALVGDGLRHIGRDVSVEEASADLVGKDFEILVITGKK